MKYQRPVTIQNNIGEQIPNMRFLIIIFRVMSKTSKGKRSTNEALSNGHDLKKAKGGGNGFKFQFNPDLTDTVLKTEFRKVWNDSARTDDWKRAGSDVTLIKEPFNCCLMKNVISGQQQELEVVFVHN